LKHRIPHRFEPLSIIGANWCCHCGFMLPLGFRGAQKCEGKLIIKVFILLLNNTLECGVVCHTKCAGLVPYFCGMSMEKANLMLSEMKAANNRRRTYHPDSLSQFSSDSHQKPLFASTSSHTQHQLSHKPYSQDNSIISPQSSISTPISPKLNPASARPLSFSHDTSSFQSLTHLFSQATISETMARANAPLVTYFFLKKKRKGIVF
jgi:hypothetical protein